MIIKLTKEEIEQAILDWTNKQMDFDYQEHKLNTVEFLYSNGCEVSWVEPEAKTEAI